jgi:hypothetical protein
VHAKSSSPSPAEQLFELSLEELKALPPQEWEKLPPEDRRRLQDRMLELEPPERRAEIIEDGAARNALVGDFTAVLGRYSQMILRDEDGEAWDCLETLAERWRDAGELRRLEQMGDGFLSDEAVQLFAALEDSLILLLSSDEQRRALRLEAEELVDRFVMAGSQGLYDGIYDSWEEAIRPKLVEGELEFGRPVQPRRVEPPKRPSGSPLAAGRRKRRDRMREPMELLSNAMLETALFYKQLDPDGRELRGEDRAKARELLEAGAACDRRIDRDRYQFSQSSWDLVSLNLAQFRAMRRSLVLALSDDPARRAKAMPAGELQSRVFVMNERLNGASYEEAWDRLQAAIAAQAN